MTTKKIRINAIKKRIAEKSKGGMPFSDSATISKETPQINVVKTSPNIANIRLSI